jgi:hypothetical protein
MHDCDILTIGEDTHRCPQAQRLETHRRCLLGDPVAHDGALAWKGVGYSGRADGRGNREPCHSYHTERSRRNLEDNYRTQRLHLLTPDMGGSAARHETGPATRQDHLICFRGTIGHNPPHLQAPIHGLYKTPTDTHALPAGVVPGLRI